MARPAASSGAAPKSLRYRRPRRETSEISPLIKYLLFAFNVILWVSSQRGNLCLNILSQKRENVKLFLILKARRIYSVRYWHLCLDRKGDLYTIVKLVNWSSIRSGILAHRRWHFRVCDWILWVRWGSQRKYNLTFSCKCKFCRKIILLVSEYYTFCAEFDEFHRALLCRIQGIKSIIFGETKVFRTHYLV